ncbi:hypothetical protein TIFTF001_005121 [Ficus carica]|uniref:Trimethylguanosine synthase n=1 Tax=Ficus carica TaxID=3494 RepID=A0AA87ZJQ2_FICCA|nr:hypothetical protein TIFTF001_005121 [Ficus carica]
MEVAEHESQGPAIKALGSLFKLTKIYLWDDGSAEARDRPSSQKSAQECDDGDDDDDGGDDKKDSNVLSTNFSVLPEDEELSQQMNALGLPLSFNTNKEKRNPRTKGKRKGIQQKHTDNCRDTLGQAVESSKASVGEIIFCSMFHENTSDLFCCMSLVGQSKSSCCNVAAGIDTYQPSSHDRDNPTSLSEVFGNYGKEQNHAAVLSNGIVCADEQDSVSENSNVEIKDDIEIAINRTSSDTGLSSGSCLTEQGDVIKECNLLEASSSSLHEAACGNICEGNGTEQLEVPESATYSSITLVLDGTENYECSGDFGDWMVFWDSYYSRNYFYNNKTQTSTWYPPEGMEHLAICSDNCNLNEMVADLTEMDASPARNALDVRILQNEVHKESMDHNILVGQAHDVISEGVGLTACNYVSALNPLSVTLRRNIEDSDELSNGIPAIPLDTEHGPSITKQKKKARKAKNRRKFSNEKRALKFQELVEFSDSMGKYWCQRYLLFSRYDDGIKMDEEGWFSVTPEPLARHHAIRCGSGTIVDSFTGVGGNAIQFAQRCKHVIAVDIDPMKIEYAHHNATIYGVNDRIDFVNGDFFLLAPRLRADTVFLSPPWGGPDYTKVETYDIKTMLKPHDGYFLFNTAKKIAPIVILFLPRNVDLNQLAELSLLSSPPWQRSLVSGREELRKWKVEGHNSLLQ